MTEERKKFVNEALAEYGKKTLFGKVYYTYCSNYSYKTYEEFLDNAIDKSEIPHSLSFNDIVEIFDEKFHEIWNSQLEKGKAKDNEEKN